MTLPGPSSADILSGYPFKLSAPAMIYGNDILDNVRRLANVFENIEIVLFHTPDLHNIPPREDIRKLHQIGRRKNVTYTVHLPASLQVAAPDSGTRAKHVELAMDLIEKTAACEPVYYILHIPYTRPTLVPRLGEYFSFESMKTKRSWYKRACASLEKISSAIGDHGQLLVENINYSPQSLQALAVAGLCEICLDVGHLVLGQENVGDVLKRFLPAAREIHLHGVKGYTDHLSLTALAPSRIEKWLKYLIQMNYEGIVNLEVFSHAELISSLELAARTLPALGRYARNLDGAAF
jgi:sugar phosphate isomerase/epimerase